MAESLIRRAACIHTYALRHAPMRGLKWHLNPVACAAASRSDLVRTVRKPFFVRLCISLAGNLFYWPINSDWCLFGQKICKDCHAQLKEGEGKETQTSVMKKEFKKKNKNLVEYDE